MHYWDEFRIKFIYQLSKDTFFSNLFLYPRVFLPKHIPCFFSLFHPILLALEAVIRFFQANAVQLNSPAIEL